jgi:hypothetical protein
MSEVWLVIDTICNSIVAYVGFLPNLPDKAFFFLLVGLREFFGKI